MRRQLMEQSSADQDRLRRQNINARLLQPGSVSLRSSLIQSMCSESCGHPRVDAKVSGSKDMKRRNRFEKFSSLFRFACAFVLSVAVQVNAVIRELRCDKPMATAACSATYAVHPSSIVYL
jgi:hypothetical protein